MLVTAPVKGVMLRGGCDGHLTPEVSTHLLESPYNIGQGKG